MARDLCFTIDADGVTFRLEYSSMELRFLGGPLLQEGEQLVGALGVFDNFTVAGGQDVSAWTAKPRLPLLRAAEQLLVTLERDRELLRHNYQYGFSTEPRRRLGGGMSLTVEGRYGSVSVGPPGQVYLRLGTNIPRRPAEDKIVDLRTSGPVKTDDRGILRVYRRKRAYPIRWEEKLPPLLEFLHSLQCASVRIRHHYADQ
jgi:hypothetical protein